MIGAATLDACLRQASYAPGLSSGFAQDFFKRQHAKLATAWDGTRYIDYILDSTEPAQGETLRTGAALRWYLRQIDELELRDVRSSNLCPFASGC